jgi:hypothetical protein
MCVSYEELSNDPARVVQGVAQGIGCAVDVDAVLAQLVELPEPASDAKVDPVSQLHHHHRTHTAEGARRDVFDPEIQRELSRGFGWWFEACGHAIE